jgi:hypothetical protein
VIRWDLIGAALTVLTWLLGPNVPAPVRVALYAISTGIIGYGIAPAVLARIKPRRRKMWPLVALCIGTLLVGFAVYWLIYERTKSDTNALPILAVECSVAKLPTVMPIGGLAFIDFFYAPEWGDAGPVGFGEFSLQPGEKLDWYPDITLGQTMRCTITNQETYTLFSVGFSLKVKFYESIERADGKTKSSGSLVKERDWPLAISKIDAGKTFTFYVLTQGKYFVRATLPEVATYLDPNANTRKDARLLLLGWSDLSVTPAVLNSQKPQH